MCRVGKDSVRQPVTRKEQGSEELRSGAGRSGKCACSRTEPVSVLLKGRKILGKLSFVHNASESPEHQVPAAGVEQRSPSNHCWDVSWVFLKFSVHVYSCDKENTNLLCHVRAF